MRYASDWRSVAFVVASLLATLAPFTVAELPAWFPFAWVPLECLLAFCACVINHNHVHVPVFRDKAPNEAFNILLTLAKGHTSTTVYVPHNLNHHRHAGAPEDWIRMELAGRGWGVWRLARFVVLGSRSMARARRADDAPRLSAEAGRSMRLQQVALALFAGALFLLNWKRAVLFALLPWGAGMAALLAVNLLQHDGCDPTSELAHSRNFVGRLDNWLFFNNGFHTAHHRWPGLHWSLLRERHECAVAPFVPPKLDRRSLAGCVLLDYALGSGPPTL